MYAAYQPNKVPPKESWKHAPKPYAANKQTGQSGSRGNQTAKSEEAARKAGEKDPCPHDGLPHLMIACDWFNGIPPVQRAAYVKQVGRCSQCFYPWFAGHDKVCKGRKCRKCSGAHHTMLCTVEARHNSVFEFQWEEAEKAREMVFYNLNVARLNDPTTVAEGGGQYAYSTMSNEEIAASLQETFLVAQEH